MGGEGVYQFISSFYFGRVAQIGTNLVRFYRCKGETTLISNGDREKYTKTLALLFGFRHCTVFRTHKIPTAKLGRH